MMVKNRPNNKEIWSTWLPWVSVFIGSITLFSYGILREFPTPISHAIGTELISQACRDFVLVATFAAFIGRIFILALWEPIFTIFRVLVLQIPLQIFGLLPPRYRKKTFRRIANLRFYLDGTYVAALLKPLESSLLIGGVVFLYLMSGEWKLVVGVVLTLIVVSSAAYTAERNFKNGLRLKLRFYRGGLPNYENLRQLSYSTMFLLVSLISSNFWFDSLLKDSTKLVSLPDHRVLFFTDRSTILINSSAVDRQSISEWKMVASDEVIFHFED